MSNLQWGIPSNNGWQEVLFDVKKLHSSVVIEFSATLCGEFWYRGDTTCSSLVEDFSVELPSVLVPRGACEELLGKLELWLRNQVEFRSELVSMPGQKMAIQIEQKDGLLTSVEKPAAVFVYEAPAIKFEIYFLVDQSCVRLAAKQLRGVLDRLAAN